MKWRTNTLVEAEITIGASRWRTLWRHVVPQTFSSVVVLATLLFGWSIVAGSGLSLIDANSADKVERLVRDAVAKGAIVVTGGKRLSQPDKDVHFFEPTVLLGVTDEMINAGEDIRTGCASADIPDR